jgi:hypothetical protein
MSDVVLVSLASLRVNGARILLLLVDVSLDEAGELSSDRSVLLCDGGEAIPLVPGEGL